MVIIGVLLSVGGWWVLGAVHRSFVSPPYRVRIGWVTPAAPALRHPNVPVSGAARPGRSAIPPGVVPTDRAGL
ncbi:hypothetical protein [Arthrobacter sp. 9V]|uniref:hypothetical protein n=1 Tax=Arthrobacter sp. 9V TaxID=2653132 RepID=UPI00135CE661|nr:hypothetical protein [Arthrobacter sp. 9V]